MNPYAAQQQYTNNLISTASPEQLLLMLYNGAIRFIRQAITASDNNNQIEKLGRISKAFAIIVEFSNTLNHDIGGEIAADLDALYQFMMRELNKARNETDGKSLKTVEGLLIDLRDTWAEAIEINRKENEPKSFSDTASTTTHAPLAVAG
ncbi:MAG: flagellar export chaperone FliS [Proteobacteria bacterium]|nr:flagellar export chaperone FliS [Pseudomonadota bacterium]MBU1057431.1 flagellar export chaperone FliS [Pseudomonadota bacterium]